MELDGRAVEAWLRELKGSPRLLLVLKSGGPKGEDSDVL
jgi:hypothetical protein